MPDNASNYHLAYLTANDRKGFFLDYLHFCNMARLPPGVATVEITIVVSQIRPISTLDTLALDELVRCAETSPWLSVRSVIWKGNVGRDFSSAAVALKEIAEVASDPDYVMVRNRSGFGPLMDCWYQRYIDQYRKHSATGLVGSTINLVGHPLRPDVDDSRHVQTYVYLSQWLHLAPYVDDYPGSKYTDRLDIIAQGEIGLSKQIMSRGLRISCLNWPQQVFSASSQDEPSLPREDIKKQAVELPFLYKFATYAFSPTALSRRFVWFWFLGLAATLELLRLRRLAKNSNVRRLYVADYD